MRRKLCALLVVSGLILCQNLQIFAEAEDELLETAEEICAEEEADEAPGADTPADAAVSPDADCLSETENFIDAEFLVEADETVTETENAAVMAAEPEQSFFGVLISDTEGNINTGGTYMLDYPDSPFGVAPREGATNNFVVNGSHVSIVALPGSGFKFAGWYQGEPNRPAGEPVYSGTPLSTDATYEFDAPLDMPLPYLCAVFEEDTQPERQGDQVQMWVGNLNGQETMSQSGGKVAVKYTPSDPNIYELESKDGTSFVYGEILQFYKGDECTVYARPDTGYSFAGWYHVDIEWPEHDNKSYEGDVISTAASFTYQPGVTVVPGDTEPLRYVCAVFRENTGQYTVSFNPGTGTGSMDAASVDAGTEYILPECSFTHANSERIFYKWFVNDELMDPGDPITVNGDTEVTAKWHYTRSQTINNSVDRSVTEVVGRLVLTETREGTVTEEVVFDEATASEFTQPFNITVNAMIAEAKDALPQKAQEYAGGSSVTVVSETVSDPQIKRTIDNRTYTYFDNAIDTAGDYFSYLIIDGSYLHLWSIVVTYTASYEKHVHSLSATAAVPATCTGTGMKAYWTCSGCGKIFSDKAGTTEVTDKSTLAIPAAGHKWNTGYTVDRQPTYTAAGSKSIHCSVCSAVKPGSSVAIPKLVEPNADYSKVDAALKKIPANLSIYTDATAAKVTAAKNAVKRGLKKSQQAKVDAMAKAIEDAVKGLVKKPAAPPKLTLIAAYNGAHGIGVKWVKLAGVTEYTIWQKYNGSWRAIKSVKPNDRSLQAAGNTLMYTDQTVKNGYGKGYIYSVSAKIGSTVVDYDRTGVAIYRLNPPILTKAVNSKAGTADVTWKGVFGKTETNGAYDLQYASETEAKAGKWKSVSAKLGNTTTKTTVTGLKKGVKYIFRIRCSKTNKDRGTFFSEYSPWLSVTVKK